jgi:CRISPR-associated protein Cmr2
MLAALESQAGVSLRSPAVDLAKIRALVDAPYASFPNTFELECDDPERAAVAAVAALRAQWAEIADAVWKHHVAPAERFGVGTRDIWERQTSSFWEISWAVGGASILARRKNWRLIDPTIEPGDHCTLMPVWQELSGHSNRRSGDQRRFWSEIRASVENDLAFDDRERLCAIALIKRLYQPISRQKWPSTADMAVEPWRQALIAAKPRDPELSNATARYESALTAARKREARIENIDGTLLLRSGILNARASDIRSEVHHQSAIEALQNLYDKAKSAGLTKYPTSFYALILADGDRVGEALDALRKKGDLTALNALTGGITSFGESVPHLPTRARCIYAGGDDVLAFCPTEDALQYARGLADEFTRCCGVAGDMSPTLSVAVVLAHYKYPLRDVLTYAHHLLDDIAKEQSGRDSLALGLLKSSGLAAQFAAPWQWWVEKSGPFATRLEELQALDKEDEFGVSFGYKIRALAESLRGPGKEATKNRFVELGELKDRWPSLILAEALVGRSSENKRDVLREKTERWLKYTRRVTRASKNYTEDRGTFSLDGPRLATFFSRREDVE